MIIEFKKWITKCNGCGKEVEGTGPKPVPPPGWHYDTPTSYNTFSDGYAIVLTGLHSVIGSPYQTKHWCPNCWTIKDTIE